MHSVPPSPMPHVMPRPPALGQPQRSPSRAKLTDRLLYTWERLRPGQRDAAWDLIANMRATLHHERRRRALISVLLVAAVLADALLVYLLLIAPAH